MYEEEKKQAVDQDNVTFIVPCIHFHGISRPNGDMATEFKNVSPGYVEGTVTAELYAAETKEWMPISPNDNYAYAGKVRWDFAPGQVFTGNLSLPQYSGAKSVGHLIDLLDGAWLRITIKEEKYAVNGTKLTIHHPSRYYHWSSVAMAWIPEPCFLG